MPSSPFALLFAQATNLAANPSGVAPDTTAAPTSSIWQSYLIFPVLLALFYFGLIRPQSQAKKKQEETIKGAKTGDKIVTTSGIHGLITNVKESTVIVKVADNVKLEIEKSHIDKITRPDTSGDAEKTVAAKVS
jgi:preprotein translocase subunit YajC